MKNSNKSILYLFSQLYNKVIENLPKIIQSKQNIINIAQNYYRGNLIELKNIQNFDQNYKSIDAISWYMKEDFIYK